MIGKQRDANTLFDVGNVWDLKMNPKSFHYQFAVAMRNGLFGDADFAGLYSQWRGRPSVPPSLLAAMVVLQCHDKVSDAEAIERSAFDLRWAAALGRPGGEPVCAKSTLQLFRTHLILHKEFGSILQRSIAEAKKKRLIVGEAITVALDTKPMLGRGAVQDTYNLLAQGMRQLARALARDENKSIKEFLDENDMAELAAPSIKGTAVVDWNDQIKRDAFLSGLVGQARRLLSMACEGSDDARKNAELLGQLLLQDITDTPSPANVSGNRSPRIDPQAASISCQSEADENGETRTSPSQAVEEKRTQDNAEPCHWETGGEQVGCVSIVRETVRDRVPSATDPEQRHGRKSASKRFDGHKTSIVTDTTNGIILSCEILPGNAGDAEGALEQIEEAQKNAGVPIGLTLGDCAYGGAETRASFADAKRTLIAKVPALPSGPFSKSAFEIDLSNAQVTCPAGHTTGSLSAAHDGRKTFHFDEYCQGCELRALCTTSSRGRSLSVHPNEGELQKARQFQNSPDGRAVLKQRLGVENALGRLAQYGIGQARYIGRAKSRFQLTITCAVANFRRSWNWMPDASMVG